MHYFFYQIYDAFTHYLISTERVIPLLFTVYSFFNIQILFYNLNLKSKITVDEVNAALYIYIYIYIYMHFFVAR